VSARGYFKVQLRDLLPAGEGAVAGLQSREFFFDEADDDSVERALRLAIKCAGSDRRVSVYVAPRARAVVPGYLPPSVRAAVRKTGRLVVPVGGVS
jgi:hypothetical protein